MSEKEKSNRDIIMAALKAIEAKTVRVDYDGSGDSGQVEDVTIERKSSVEVMDESIKVEPGAVTVSVMQKSSQFTGSGFKNEEKMTEASLEEAIKDFCYDHLENLHGGWEINEGSQGYFEIDVEKGTVKLFHGSNFMETEETEHEIDG